MHVLVVDANAPDREVLLGCLEAARHGVTGVPDGLCALSLVKQSPPDVLVVDWATSHARELVREVRSEGSDMYVIAASGRRDLGAAIAAGADDVLRKPLHREELVIRVGTAERIRARVARAGTALDWSEQVELARLRVWREAPAITARQLGQVLSVTLDASPTPPEDIALGARLVLSSVTELVKMELLVGVDVASLDALGMTALGGPAQPAELHDVLRELANQLAGALQERALEEGVRLVLGLPTDHDWAAPGPASPARVEQRFGVVAGDVALRFGVRLTLAPRELLHLPPGKLREGFVAARDVLNQAGALLIPAGTRLTTTHIDRLARLLPPSAVLDVTDTT